MVAWRLAHVLEGTGWTTGFLEFLRYRNYVDKSDEAYHTFSDINLNFCQMLRRNSQLTANYFVPRDNSQISQRLPVPLLKIAIRLSIPSSTLLVEYRDVVVLRAARGGGGRGRIGELGGWEGERLGLFHKVKPTPASASRRPSTPLPKKEKGENKTHRNPRNNRLTRQSNPRRHPSSSSEDAQWPRRSAPVDKGAPVFRRGLLPHFGKGGDHAGADFNLVWKGDWGRGGRGNGGDGSWRT